MTNVLVTEALLIGAERDEELSYISWLFQVGEGNDAGLISVPVPSTATLNEDTPHSWKLTLEPK